MLEYLITSRVRRKLLESLWNSDFSGTASAWARRASVPIGATYPELLAMTHVGLARERTEDGRRIYEANRESPYASAIRQLVQRNAVTENASAVRTRDSTDDAVRQALVSHGAALWGQAATEATVPPLETTIPQACGLARRDPTVARALPALLVRQRDALDLVRLRRAVAEYGHKHETGFFLAVAAALSGDEALAAWAEELRDRRRVKTQDFFVGYTSPRVRQLAERNTPEVARAWNFRLNMPMEAFRATLDKPA